MMASGGDCENTPQKNLLKNSNSRFAKPKRIAIATPVRTRALFPGSSVVEQPAVNRLVAGSNPARGAKFSKYLAQIAVTLHPHSNITGHVSGNIRLIPYAIPALGIHQPQTMLRIIRQKLGGFTQSSPCYPSTRSPNSWSVSLRIPVRTTSAGTALGVSAWISACTAVYLRQRCRSSSANSYLRIFRPSDDRRSFYWPR